MLYIYSKSGFEYRIKKMKSSTPLFETSFENNLLMFPSMKTEHSCYTDMTY